MSEHERNINYQRIYAFLFMKKGVYEVIFTFFIIMSIIFSLIIRILHCKLGLPYLVYWDEPQIAGTALNMLRTGDYNPHFFNYGSLLIYLNYIIDIFHYLQLVARPEDDPNHMVALSDIVTNLNADWGWTISHPSFYFWNRILTALLGTATVIVTGLLAREIFGKFWLSLLAVFLLGFLPVHVVYSGFVTTDAPAVFFVCTSIYFALRHLKTTESTHLCVSLVFCGLAAATKYNSALVVAAPACSLLWLTVRKATPFKPMLFIAVAAIPVAVFLAAMPYAILDPVNFLNGLGFEIRHYKVYGHPGATITPGFKHAEFQLQNFYQNLGFIWSVLAVIGAISIFKRPMMMLCLVAPVLFFFYMIQMRVDFHRNFLQAYPFIVLLICMGAEAIDTILGVVAQRFAGKSYRLASGLFAVSLFIVAGLSATGSIRDAITIWKSKDSRSVLMMDLGKNPTVSSLLISRELRIHPIDLHQLHVPYQIKPLDDIMKCFPNCGVDAIVLPGSVGSSNTTLDDRLNGFLHSIDTKMIREKIGDRPIQLEAPTASPDMVLVDVSGRV